MITGNPLICNCELMWLKLWLSESSAIGPKCVDGTYVKGMPFSREDCQNVPPNQEYDIRSCITSENEALLPSLATSQVFSSLDKIKDYTTQIKNNYHINKINNRPAPEESEYFYEDYVDYPYNETLVESINNDIHLVQTNKSQATGGIPTLYAGMNSTAHKTTAVPSKKPPAGGFTFFGMPLPPINMNKLLNTGRKMDWPDNKNAQHTNKNYQTTAPPKFETGGFSPVLPTTDGGFMPIPNPTMNVSHTVIIDQANASYSNGGSMKQSIAAVAIKPPKKTTNANVTTHQKMKSEIHELQAYLDDDNSTHVAYNRTKNVEEQKSDPINMSKYNLMESNLTITQVTEKEGILITTDTSNDMSLQAWLESSTKTYSSSPITSKPPVKKHIESNTQPTALSAVLVPSNDELARRNHSSSGKRPATVTKVNMPHASHYDLHENTNNYSPVINREGKTGFSENTYSGGSKPKQVDGKDWYYKNYNNSNLQPYVAPGIHTSKSGGAIFKNSVAIVAMHCLGLLLHYDVS